MAHFLLESVEDLEHLTVVVHVQGLDAHRDGRIDAFQLRLQGFQPVQAAGAQRQIAALGGEQPAMPAPRPELAPVIRMLSRVVMGFLGVGGYR